MGPEGGRILGAPELGPGAPPAPQMLTGVAQQSHGARNRSLHTAAAECSLAGTSPAGDVASGRKETEACTPPAHSAGPAVFQQPGRPRRHAGCLEPAHRSSDSAPKSALGPAAARGPGGRSSPAPAVSIDLCDDAAAKPTQPASSNEPASWDCPCCTFLNDGHLSTCEMCNTVRSSAHIHSPPACEYLHELLEMLVEKQYVQLRRAVDQCTHDDVVPSPLKGAVESSAQWLGWGIHGWMDAMDAWMDGWTDGCMDGWIGWVGEWMGGWLDGVDGWMDGWSGWMDG